MALSPVFELIRGTFETIFSFGKNRAQIRAQTVATLLPEILEVRDQLDAAYTNMRGADPIAAQDFATKAYVDATAAGEVVIRFSVALASTTSTFALPAGMRVFETRLTIMTPYSVGATIEIKRTAPVTTLQATTENNPQVAGTYVTINDEAGSAGDTIDVNIAGAPAAGAAVVVCFAAIPTA